MSARTDVLPNNLPAVANARLPQTYEAAKHALATCSEIDECKDWADKAEALASYAKQADDTSLRKTADRIQARAIRRCGELLTEIKQARGANQNIRGGTPPKVTRTSVARAAGLSDDQRKQALRVAKVPEQEFEEAVESDDPPTVTELAERGKATVPRPILDLGGRDPAEFSASTDAQGDLRRLFERTAKTPPAVVVRGAFAKERDPMCLHAEACLAWLQELVSELEAAK